MYYYNYFNTLLNMSESFLLDQDLSVICILRNKQTSARRIQLYHTGTTVVSRERAKKKSKTVGWREITQVFQNINTNTFNVFKSVLVLLNPFMVFNFKLNPADNTLTLFRR